MKLLLLTCYMVGHLGRPVLSTQTSSSEDLSKSNGLLAVEKMPIKVTTGYYHTQEHYL